jgi:hypothetical protein
MPEGWIAQTNVLTFSPTVIGIWVQIVLTQTNHNLCYQLYLLQKQVLIMQTGTVNQTGEKITC